MVATLLTHLLSVPPWILLAVVAALVFAEDALFLGFVLPGETAAILGGAAATLGRVSLSTVLLVVVLAAVAGDGVGYLVGRRLGPTLLAHHRLDRHRASVQRVQSMLERRGGPAVALGRSTAVLRALTPALAGAARMPYRRFAVWNLAGGFVWACLAVGVGYLAGSSFAAAAQTFGRAGAIVAAVVVAAVATALVLRHRRHSHERTGTP